MSKGAATKLCVLFSIIFLITGFALGANDPTGYSYDKGYQIGYDEGCYDTKEELSDYQYTQSDMHDRYLDGYNNGYKQGYESGKNVSSYSTTAKPHVYKAQSASGASANNTTTNKSTSSSSTTKSTTVYITNTGSKYHRYGCQYLRQSCIAISLSSAKAQGYTACSKCW